MSSLFTGILEGGITFSNNGTPNFLPFSNKLMKVNLKYEGTLVSAETFSSRGVSGASASCLTSEKMTIMLESEDITWAFLTAAAGTIPELNTAPIHREITAKIGATQTTITLPSAPVTGQPIYVADETGKQVATSNVGAVVTFTTPSQAQGKVVTVIYFEAATLTSEVMKIGSGRKISEMSLYGRFRGCGDVLGNGANDNSGDLIWIAERCANKPGFELNAEAGQKSKATLELDVLRDTSGDYVRLYAL